TRRYAPRSGGRTTEQRNATTGGRRYATQGSAALQPVAEPTRTTGAVPRLRVAPPVPINAPRAPFIALLVVLVLAGVFGILLINTKTNENSFELADMQKRQAQLDSQEQRLRNQIAGYE